MSGDQDTHDASGYRIVTFPDPEHCVYRIGDTTYVLDASETGWTLSNGRFATKRLVVYAERINIIGDVEARGKDIELYCHDLSLQAVEGKTTVTLNTSGSLPTREAYMPSPGEDGQSGGNVKIFVQSADTTMLDLRIITNGADGQAGYDGDKAPDPVVNPQAGSDPAPPKNTPQDGDVYSSDPSAKTASEPAQTAGGNGGASGNITIAFGSKHLAMFTTMGDLEQVAWPTQIGNVNLYFMPTLDSVKDYPKTVKDATATILAKYGDYAKSLYALRGQLKVLLDRFSKPTEDEPAPTQTAADDAAAVVDSLTKHLSALVLPTFDVAAVKTLAEALTRTIGDWLDQGGDDAESSMATDMKQFALPKQESATASWRKSELGNQIEKAFIPLEYAAMDFSASLENHCTYAAGRAADGGVGKDGTHADGGKDGSIGTLSVNLLMFDGSKVDAELAMPFASAEQCYMLLTRANDSFFNGDIGAAGSAYERLLQRLVPILWCPEPDAQGTVATTALQKAYQDAQIRESSIFPMQQFNEIQAQAETYLKYITSGKDMFGHEPSWVPRLTYQILVKNIETQLPALEKFETQQQEYEAAWKKNADIKSIAKKTLAQANEDDITAQSTIDLLLGHSGQLAQLDAKIKKLSPDLRNALKAIQPALARIESDIDNNFDWDVGEVLSAFASFTMAPSKIFALGTVFSTLWKSSQDIKDDNGIALPQENVISSIGQAGDNIDSMMESYHRIATGGYEPDDPGAAKLIVSAQALKDIVNKYKATLKDREDLNVALDKYIGLVQSRNEAVISYNIALQMVVDARESLKTANTEEDKAGSQLIEINPRIPGVYYRSRKRADSLRLSIMRNLNYATRALRYFSLSSELDENIKSEDLKDHKTLSDRFQSLKTHALNALAIIASHTTNHFPPTPLTPTSRGPFVHLTVSERDALLTLGATSTTYWTTVTIRPPTSLPAGEAIKSHGYAFNGWRTVRVSQVRLWMPGAIVSSDNVNEPNINITITHLGDEEFVTGSSANPVVHTYKHEPVVFSFNYFTNKVHTKDDCVTANVASSQDGEGEGLFAELTGADNAKYAVAQVSPFAQWRLEISPAEHENPGLDLRNVKDVYMEFFGASSSSV